MGEYPALELWLQRKKQIPAMFLRFVVPEIDEDSERELGVFQAIHKLRKSGVLSGCEEGQDDLIAEWFDENLANLHVSPLLSLLTTVRKAGQFRGLKVLPTNISLTSGHWLRFFRITAFPYGC
jgi:hypothetical protein